MDCSLPGSSIHGIFQAGVLEWGAIAFSDLGLYCVVNLFSVIKGSVANRYCMVTIGPRALYALVVSKQ